MKSLRKVFILFLMTSALITSVCFASPPPPGTQRSVEVKGEPLTIYWQEPSYQPRLVVWVQEYVSSNPFYVQEGNQITIDRAGINDIPTQLLVVPKENHFLPKILNVSKDQREILFTTQPIPNNEVWFWGITPKNSFPPPQSWSSYSIAVGVRMLRDKHIYHSLYGPFLFSIKQKDSKQYTEEFYFTSDNINAVFSDGFVKGNDIADALCRIYLGGDDYFLFETKKDSWGKAYQIDFSIKHQDFGPIY